MDRNKLLLIYFSGLKRNSSHGSIESKIDENEYLSLFSDAKPKKNKENSGLRKFLPINYHCISVKTYKIVNRAKMHRKYHIWVAKWYSRWLRVKIFIIFDLKCIIFEIFDISNSLLEWYKSGDFVMWCIWTCIMHHVTEQCNTMWSPRLTESNKTLELRSSTLKPASNRKRTHFTVGNFSFWIWNFRISTINKQQPCFNSR